MNIIDLGKLRFHFAGQFDAGANYEYNDIVKYGGNVYCYIYALKEPGHLPTDTKYWDLMVEGIDFQGVFSPTTAYKVGQGIAYGGKVYIAIADSQGQIPPNAAFWSQFVDGVQYEGVWSNLTAYQKNDMVKYGACMYIAKVDNTNANPVDPTKWDKMVDGISAQSVWNSATAYVPNDVVAYGANLYRALVNNTNIVPGSDPAKWDLYIGGASYKGVYSAAAVYLCGEIVAYGANLYRVKTTVQSVTAGVLPTDNTKYDLFLSGVTFSGVWSSANAYTIGSLVSYGANLYRAKADSPIATLPTDTSKWDLLNTGFRNTGPWTTAATYLLNDVVSYGGNTFICLVPHASAAFNADLAAAKWQKFNGGVRYRGTWATGVSYLKDDMLTDGISLFIVLNDYVSGATSAADIAGVNLQMTARGASGVPVFTLADKDKTITNDGVNLIWTPRDVFAGREIIDGVTLAPIVASMFSVFSRQGAYSSMATGNTSPAAPQLIPAGSQGATDAMQLLNIAMGDGYGASGSATQPWLMDDTGGMNRRLEYAAGLRLGHRRTFYSMNNPTSYPPIGIRIMPVRNNSAVSKNITLNFAHSAYSEGAALYVGTPTTGLYSAAAAVAWTVPYTYSGSIYETTGSTTITIPPNTTVLIMLANTMQYQTTNMFQDINYFYGLNTTFSDPAIQVDMRMLTMLAHARLPANYSYSSNEAHKVYNQCAKIYGDR
jgi:hypothetical protein